MSDYPEILDVKQLSELLGMNPVVVNRLAKSGVNGFPPGKKIGSGTNCSPRRWFKEDIIAWLRTPDTNGGREARA